jgi:hypothetical protein
MRLFQRILAGRFAELAPEVQALHAGVGIREGEITLHSAPVMRLLGYPPPCKDAPLWFGTREEENTAIWRRQIKDRELVSLLWQSGEEVSERMGAATITSRLELVAGRLIQVTTAVRLFDMPVPRVLWPQITAQEWGECGRYHFKVEVRAPIAGFVLLAYEGWLNPAAG